MVRGTVVWHIVTMNKAFCRSTNGGAGRTTEDRKEIPYRADMPVLVKINIWLSSHPPLPVKKMESNIKISACWPLVPPGNDLVLGI